MLINIGTYFINYPTIAFILGIEELCQISQLSECFTPLKQLLSLFVAEDLDPLELTEQFLCVRIQFEHSHICV